MTEGRNLKSPGSESGKSKRTYHRKRYEELTFSDDFMFCKILENNEELCKELIELVLGKKIAIIHNVEKQKAIETSSDNKGVRLDVRVLADNRIFALEMQNAKKDNLPRRTRYYQSMVDIDISEHGSDYKNLMDSCIIFICNFDPFEQNICRYTVKPHIEELPEYEYNDGTVKIFLSATVANRESSNISEELQDFLQYAQSMIRENFILNVSMPEGQSVNYMDDQEAQFSSRFHLYVNHRNVEGIMNELAQAEKDIAQNGAAKIIFFDLSLKLIMLLKQ